MKTLVVIFYLFFFSHSMQCQSDQTLDWFTYYGGTGSEGVSHAIPAPNGAVIIAGSSDSSTEMGMSGAYQAFNAGDRDVFLAMFDSLGNPLWRTYYGGEDFDAPAGLVAINDSVFAIVGATLSSTGIATAGAQMDELPIGGQLTGFFAKFSIDGELLSASYIIGEGNYGIGSVAISPVDGSIYIGGVTAILDMATEGAWQEDHMGANEGFISKYNPELELEWCTYFGTPVNDQITELKVNADYDLIFSASTKSESGLATDNANLTTGVGRSLVLGKFSSDGDLLWSTYVSGDGDETSGSVQIGGDDKLYVSGRSSSLSGIATSGAHLETNVAGEANLGSYVNFIRAYNTNGSLLWGTYFGETGMSLNAAPSIACTQDHIYLEGTASTSTGVLFGADPFQPQNNSSGDDIVTVDDNFVVKLDTSGQVIWSTYFGGNANESISAILAINNGNKIFIAGGTLSNDFYGTDASWQSSRVAAYDGFLATFSDNLVTTVVELAENNSILIYPNPLLNELHIAWDHPIIEFAKLRIFDMQGRPVYHKHSYSKNKSIDINLKSGIYILEISLKDKKYVQKIVIQ